LRSVSLPLLLLLLAVAACAHARSDCAERVETVRAGGVLFELRYEAADAHAAEQVREALAAAVPAAERWGRLRTSVLVTIHPTHRDLEAAAKRTGYGWLRAWTRYRSVDLQSPRTWSRGAATDAEMAQLLAHEITHCVMYQAAAAEASWQLLRIPLWFREGMATVTAGERKHVGAAEIRRFYQEAASASAPAGDPLSHPEPLYRAHADLVYGTAQRAFQFLLDRYGEGRIRRVLSDMREGSEFAPAFEREVGIPLAAFEREFRRYVAWHGGPTLQARGM
jgi:hypothetical protein